MKVRARLVGKLGDAPGGDTAIIRRIVQRRPDVPACTEPGGQPGRGDAGQAGDDTADAGRVEPDKSAAQL
jgi:hypothetical protein